MNTYSSTAEPPEAPWYSLLWHTPLTTLAVFVTISLIVRENYPFSHFPMYSSPTARKGYYVVTDSDGRPLPITTLTGITIPKIGKIHWRKSREREATARSGEQDPAGQEKAIGQEIFEMLREQGTKRGQILPPKMQLYHVEIQSDDGKIKETKRLLYGE
jgi:hypothetical protein